MEHDAKKKKNDVAHAEPPRRALSTPKPYFGIITIIGILFWVPILINGWGVLIAFVTLFWVPILAMIFAYLFGVSIAKMDYYWRKLKNGAGAFLIYLLLTALLIWLCIEIIFIEYGHPAYSCADGCSYRNDAEVFTIVIISTVVITLPTLLGILKYMWWNRKYDLPTHPVPAPLGHGANSIAEMLEIAEDPEEGQKEEPEQEEPEQAEQVQEQEEIPTPEK